MKQDIMYCYTHPEEYPYEANYYTAKTGKLKIRYFRSIEEIKAWISRNKNIHIAAASWQVYAIRNGLA